MQKVAAILDTPLSFRFRGVWKVQEAAKRTGEIILHTEGAGVFFFFAFFIILLQFLDNIFFCEFRELY